MVNPHEWLYTPGDVGYHDTPTLDDDVDEVYREEELAVYFIAELGTWFDDLVRDADDIQMPEKRKQKPINKKVWLPSLWTRVPDHDANDFETKYKYYFYSHLLSEKPSG
jgi:hypothetical protein